MNILINNADIEEKTELFVSSFGDSKETAEEFFSCSDVITVTKYVGKRLAAMASLIPIHAESKSMCQLERMAVLKREICGYYIYGVCVGCEYRGMGLFRSVMDMAESFAEEKGADFLCLIPADERLATTYRKWGYNVKIQNINSKVCVEKLLLLDSKEFRDYAMPSDNFDDGNRMYGLMKLLNKKIFDPCDFEYTFGDYMGDI